jgi:hypothetical protein
VTYAARRMLASQTVNPVSGTGSRAEPAGGDEGAAGAEEAGGRRAAAADAHGACAMRRAGAPSPAPGTRRTKSSTKRSRYDSVERRHASEAMRDADPARDADVRGDEASRTSTRLLAGILISSAASSTSLPTAASSARTTAWQVRTVLIMAGPPYS